MEVKYNRIIRGNRLMWMRKKNEINNFISEKLTEEDALQGPLTKGFTTVIVFIIWP